MKIFLNKFILLLLVTTISVFAVGVDTAKYENASGESIKVKLSASAGNDNDWVGIYPAGSSNDWENVVSWSFTNGIVDGNLLLDGVSAGNYDVRLFFSNSFHLEAKVEIKVIGGGNGKVSISTSKDTYKVAESIDVTFSNMSGDGEDWIGIYPAGASNDWDNIVSWAWTNGVVSSTLSLDGVPAGNYEVRAFFSNSFKVEASTAFNVSGENIPHPGRTVYENANNALSDNWDTVLGNYNPIKIDGAVKLTTHWLDNQTNLTEYWLYINAYHTKLSLDVGGVGSAGGHVGGIHDDSPAGYMPHYFVGVYVDTTYGERSMIWDSWLNHNNWGASIDDYGNGNIELTFPSPVELVTGFGYTSINSWRHFNVNLQKSLESLEPGNSIISIMAFTASGGYLDNITLE